MTNTFFLKDEQHTIELGQQLGQLCAGHGLIFLEGDLGAGKTTLSRGILRGLGHTGAVKSPTFTIVEPYKISQINAYHFDLYRLSDPDELEFLGIRDYLADDSLCLIEWPQRGEGVLPKPDLHIKLRNWQQGRQIELTALSKRAESWCKSLNTSQPTRG